MALRVLAISAPDWVEGSPSDFSLQSSDPVSLYNACKIAGADAAMGKGVWGSSNWAGEKRLRRQKFLLMRSLSRDLEKFVRLLESERPNLLLIGSMTVAFPGAIECAKAAKELLGGQVLIVLGGYHANETLFLNRENKPTYGDLSPLNLMATGTIPKVFDVVVSGKADSVIHQIGIFIDKIKGDFGSFIPELFEHLSNNCSYGWCCGAYVGGKIITASSQLCMISRSEAALPYTSIFGVTASFNIFKPLKTFHAFSSEFLSCIYSCFFCSEGQASRSMGKLSNSNPQKLQYEFECGARTIEEDHGATQSSAFVEDPVFLNGSADKMNTFCDLLAKRDLNVSFGVQSTIDLVRSRRNQLKRLRDVGLKYIYIGVELMNLDSLKGISKNMNKTESWKVKIESCLYQLQEDGILCGIALCFGLGEDHESRIKTLLFLKELKAKTGNPVLISANWGVQHPMKRLRMPYDYTRWGTPPGPFLNQFLNLGEASLLYPFKNVQTPSIQEVTETITLFKEIRA